MLFCFQRQQRQFAIASIITVLVALAPLTNAAAPQHVDWQWPLVDIGPGAAEAHSYNAVDIVNASWTSNLDFQPFLVVWCQTDTGFTANQSGSVPASGWHLVSLNLGLSTPPPIKCHFGLDDLNHKALTTPSTNSGYFNITKTPDKDPQIFGASTSAAAPTTIVVTAAGAAGATSTAPASAATSNISPPQGTGNNSDSGSGLGAGAIAGIVIGVLLLIGSAIFIFFFFCVRKRRRSRREREAPTDTAAAEMEHTPNMQTHPLGELDGREEDRHKELLADEGLLKNLVSDKDAPERRAEMAADERRETEEPAELEGGRDAAPRTSMYRDREGTNL